MADSIRRQIQLSVVAALAALPGMGAAGQVELGRDTEPPTLPALSLVDLGDSAITEDVFQSARQMRLQIVGDVEGDGGEGAAAAMDALLSGIISACQADPQWAGKARNTDLGELLVDPPAGAEIRGLTFALTLVIEYAHRRGDPFTI